MTRKIRTLRHWKQRFDPNARFMFRKRIVYNGQITFDPGDLVPENLIPPHRIRRWWESRIIELAEFEEPDVATGKVEHDQPSVSDTEASTKAPYKKRRRKIVERPKEGAADPAMTKDA